METRSFILSATRILLFMLLGMGTMACVNSRTPRELTQADAVIEDNPDSALRILSGIDPRSIDGERNKALYTLLSAQGKMRLRDYDVDSTAVGKARDYFNRQPEKDYAMRANYYSAYKHYLDSSFNDAIIWGTKALLDAEDHKRHHWIGRCADLIGWILNNSDMAHESIEYNRKAYLSYKRCNRIKNSRYSLCDLAINLGSIDKNHEADSIYSDCMRSALNESPVDTNLFLFLIDPAIRIKTKLGEWDRALALINLKKRYKNSDKLSTISYVALANAALTNEDLALVKIYLDSANVAIHDDYDREIYNRILKSYSERTGDKILEKKSSDELLKINESIIKNKIEHPVFQTLSTMTSAHHKSKFEGYRSKTSKSLILLVSLLTLSAIVVFILVIKYRIKRIKNKNLRTAIEESTHQNDIKGRIIIENEKKLTQAYEEVLFLKQQIDNQDKEHASQIGRLSNALRDEFSIVIDMCEALPEFEGPKNNIAERALILKDKIETKLEDQSIHEFINSIDLINGGLTSRLKVLCPGLNKSLVSLFSLYSLGFSTKGISTFLKINRNSIDQRKSRLKNEILKLPEEEREKFLKIINQKKREK